MKASSKLADEVLFVKLKEPALTALTVAASPGT
jgi:hypothetical protein